MIASRGHLAPCRRLYRPGAVEEAKGSADKPGFMIAFDLIAAAAAANERCPSEATIAMALCLKNESQANRVLAELETRQLIKLFSVGRCRVAIILETGAFTKPPKSGQAYWKWLSLKKEMKL